MRHSYLLIVITGCLLVSLLNCTRYEENKYVDIEFSMFDAKYDTIKVYQLNPLIESKIFEQNIILDSLGMGRMQYACNSLSIVKIEVGKIGFPISVFVESGKGLRFTGAKTDLLNTLEITGDCSTTNNFSIKMKKIVNKYSYIDSLYFFQLDSISFDSRFKAMKEEITLATSNYLLDNAVSKEVENLLIAESELESAFILINYYLVQSRIGLAEAISIPWNQFLLQNGDDLYRMVLSMYLDLEMVNPFWNSYIEENKIPEMVVNRIYNSNMPLGFKDYLIAQFLYQHHLQNANFNTGYYIALEKYKSHFPKSVYISELSAVSEKLNHLAQGQNAPQILGTTIDGGNFKLSDYRGKMIYIDVWATWCSPCIQQLKQIRTIETELNDIQDFVFIYISIDEDLTKWRKFLTNNDLHGTHINASQGAFRIDYSITNIPRQIIIDRHGKILTPNYSGHISKIDIRNIFNE